MKVMLVDDSSTMRRIQKTQLAGMGLTDVVEASNGKEALDLLDKGGVDLVLLDWNMPELDGMGFLKKMRENGAFKDVKVIMCTSESEKSRVIEALKTGANSYIVKPFGPQALKDKLGL